jgi:hypothetical protein
VAVAGALLARESLDEAELRALLRQAREGAGATGSGEQGPPRSRSAKAGRPAAEHAPAA